MADELDRIRGYVYQSLPNANADGSSTWLRLARNGEQIVRNGIESRQQQADEGAYFSVTNPTIGTAVATAVIASYDITKGHFVLFNNNTVASGIRVYPDFIKMLPTVAPASGTCANYAIQLDNTNRYTSGGAAATAKNVNMDSARTSAATFYAPTGGTIITVATATANARIVARGTLRNVIPAALESMVLKFGAGEDASSATAAGTTVAACPPVVIGPQQSMVVLVWYPSNSGTGISFEFSAGWVEK